MPRVDNGTRRRVCYIRNSYYMYAAHLHRNVQALGRAGFDVTVIVLRAEGQPRREALMEGVEIYRLPIAHKRGGLLRYVWEYASFFVLAFCMVATLHARKRFDFVEVDNMPDALVFTALLPKLTGARVILYVADCMADLMVGSKGLRPRHALVRLMRAQERLSALFADRVIVPNHATARRLTAAGVPAESITLVLNSPDDERLFTRRAPRTWDPRGGALRIVTHGTLIEHYGVQVLLDALPKLAEALPGVQVDIFGDGEYRAELEDRARRLGVADRVRFSGFVPHTELPALLAEADIGYAGPLVDLLVANKMLEYLALGIPMVLARWPALEDHFPEDCVSYFTPGDADNLARCVLSLYHDPEGARARTERASKLYERSYRWAVQRETFLSLYADRPPAIPSRSDNRLTTLA